MSISDLIVVMKKGVVQQIGKPQDVYDNPANLFVAKFLGTPPINVFAGQVREQYLYLDGQRVLKVPGVSDREVIAGVRPEGFVPEENGPMICKLSGVEVMGRDVSVVCRHSACENAAIRAIISAENRVDTTQPTVRFSFKPAKVFLFAADTELRLRPAQEV